MNEEPRLTAYDIVSKANTELIIDDSPNPLEELMMKEEPDYYEDYPTGLLKYIRILSLALLYIKESKTDVAVYGVIYALGLSHLTEGKSMNQLSQELGMNHSGIHYHKVRFETLLEAHEISLDI